MYVGCIFRNMQRLIPILLTVGTVLGCAKPSQASPGLGSNLEFRSNVALQVQQSGPFQVPSSLRPRVDFWKAIFSKYGKNQVVIHHRNFPQIIFGVMDFSREADGMTPVELQRYRDQVEARTVKSIKTQIKSLAEGNEPSNDFQRKVADQMAFLPGGSKKYQEILDDDLIRTQTGIREKYSEAIRRSWRYLPTMEQIFVTEYGLPRELTRLPFIESSFDYSAYSSVGAAGLWQLMPRTARSFGMKVGKVVDERRDPLKATRAGARYLREAFQRLGSWPLAITSYNHGIGGVSQKVSQAGTTNLAAIIEDPSERYFGFASSNFFPEFLAALELFDNRQAYFPEVRPEPPLRLFSVRISSAMSAKYISQTLGITLEDLKEANYALLDPVWRGAAKIPAGYSLNVPLEYRSRVERLGAVEPKGQEPEFAPSTVYGGVTYKVRKGDTLASIAKKYKTTSKELIAINGLYGATVKVGQSLIVREQEADKPSPTKLSPSESKQVSVVKSKPTALPVKESKTSPKSQVKSQAKEVRTYTVQSGDSLWSISKKFGVSVEALKKANGVSAKSLKAGKVIKVP